MEKGCRCQCWVLGAHVVETGCRCRVLGAGCACGGDRVPVPGAGAGVVSWLCAWWVSVPVLGAGCARLARCRDRVPAPVSQGSATSREAEAEGISNQNIISSVFSRFFCSYT